VALHNERLTEQVVGAATEVHRALGPGLLESAYRTCLARELTIRGIPYETEIPQPLSYKGVHLDCGYRLDFVIDAKLVVVLKAVAHLMPIHEAQLLTYLRLSGLRAGLLINFDEPVLKDGIIRRFL
jgi:GxxExxY protein